MEGLPLPLVDSFGDCFGPQLAVHAEYALEGLDFRHVPGSSPALSSPEVEGAAGLRGTWFLRTGPAAAEREDEDEGEAPPTLRPGGRGGCGFLSGWPRADLGWQAESRLQSSTGVSRPVSTS